MISIIIPTYNEALAIEKTIGYLEKNDPEKKIAEIIVADGGSTDGTKEKATAAGAIFLECRSKGRAAQMNEGAEIAKGEILYFLHADTIPPDDFIKDIIASIEAGAGSGCFRLAFDHDHWFLKANCWFTRFDVNLIRFGDQSLFLKKELFLKSGGFNTGYIVMEDQEIISRLKRLGKFKVIPKPVITSARKYKENGIYKTQGIFFLIWFMYYLGFSQQKLVQTYKKMIRQDKL
jgi:rSAM/selenodomain-associated transferase 2